MDKPGKQETRIAYVEIGGNSNELCVDHKQPSWCWEPQRMNAILNRDEGGRLNHGAGVVVFPRAEPPPQKHGNTTTHSPPATGIPRPRPPRRGNTTTPPPSPPNLCPTLRGGGSWYSRSPREHLPLGIPRPRPPGLAAPLRLFCYTEATKRPEKAYKHLAHKQFPRSPWSPILPAGHPDKNDHVPWLAHTAHKHLTNGHPAGRNPPPPSPKQSPDKIVYVYVPFLFWQSHNPSQYHLAAKLYI